MPEWLSATPTSLPAMTPADLISRLLLAVAYGGCVAGIYRLSHGRLQRDASVLVATLVLLSVLIAMVSMVIGDSVARAFSLVGALSIVRFRTVVEDTRDTAFVIFAVIVGMAAGAGTVLMPLVGIPLVGAVAVLLSRRSDRVQATPRRECQLSLRFGLGRDPDRALEHVFARYLDHHRLLKVETARQGALLDLVYRIQLRADASPLALVSELNQTEGVQGVSLDAERSFTNTKG